MKKHIDIDMQRFIPSFAITLGISVAVILAAGAEGVVIGMIFMACSVLGSLKEER